ncbi:unnamed protein product [Prorocentrum cordatum]|uniref:Uncharacterized protein n=1 Tax=Prorocentrum cordatum TaxID=2364126 RepID=A0ABN9U2A7_9DINO|nr:unnamed protein product [Polarella glacialis]
MLPPAGAVPPPSSGRANGGIAKWGFANRLTDFPGASRRRRRPCIEEWARRRGGNQLRAADVVTPPFPIPPFRPAQQAFPLGIDEVRADLGTVCARAAVSFLWREHPQAAARHSGAPGAGAGGGVPLQRHPRASAVPTATTATS